MPVYSRKRARACLYRTEGARIGPRQLCKPSTFVIPMFRDQSRASIKHVFFTRKQLPDWKLVLPAATLLTVNTSNVNFAEWDLSFVFD
jgi:hypothetical protein